MGSMKSLTLEPKARTADIGQWWCIVRACHASCYALLCKSFRDNVGMSVCGREVSGNVWELRAFVADGTAVLDVMQ